MRLRLCKKLRKIRDRITRKARRRNPPIDSAPRASSSSGIEASFSTPTSAQPEKPAVATGRNEQTKDDSTSQRAQKDNKDMVPASSEMATALKAAKEGISAMNPSSLAERGVAVVDQKKDLAQGLVSTAKSWGPMLSRVKKFTELVDKLVHPYAEMAWSILSIVQKTVIGQVELDRSIYDLLDTIQDVYEFVEEAGPLNDVLSARDVLVALAQQTTECGYFIRDYAKDKDFATRMASNVYKKVFKSDEAVPELVKDYRCNLKKLRSKLLDHATIRTEITVNRIWNAVKDIADNVRMGLLEEACAKGYWYNSEKKCLPRTRETILRIILDWIHDQDDSRRALVLSGPAGVGKSAIAHTIASIFDKNQHLGSCYFFDRNKDMLTNAQFLFPTIARDLSQRFPLMKTVLADVVARNSALLTSDDLAEQFRCLIAEPAKKLTIPGPIVIVVDALDECKESVEKFEQSAHRLLLSILSTKEEEGGLPANFRILVTCRFQPSIMATLGSNVRHESMTRILKNPDNAKDLRLYVHDKLSQSHAELQDFESICDRIVQWAEGIFQWAATAFRFIASSTGTQSIKQRMETIKPSREGEGQLDRLYMQVLRFGILSEQGNDTNLKNYQTVMRLILVPREPLSVSDLQDILYRQDDSDHREIVKRVVECMASLLSGSNNTEEVVRPYHSSFLDFVLDRKRSGKFCVEPGKEEHEAFARGTLRILLGKRLHFNMCKLKTSYRLNADIPGLGERVRANIPPSLVYSARYWADHLEKIAYDPDLQEMTEQFLKNKFLFWVEVLSLIESMVTCASALGILKEWIPKACHFYDVVAELEMGSIIKDFLRFIRAFGMTIGASAPHLYLSALAFAPASSKICQLYEARFSRRAIVECGRSEEWPALECTMEGHDDRVLCAEFSRNGKDVSVSYSYKGFTTRVWNAETGQPTRRPVHCDAGGSWASCAAFSSEKDLVAAGMNHGMILVYSSTKGQTIHTLRGHTKQVRSVAFSTDGKRVVSGSDDQKVCIWDVPSEQLVHLPLQRHTDKVTSVAFSPDSNWDCTIRFWDASTECSESDEGLEDDRAVLPQPHSVSFSPNRSHALADIQLIVPDAEEMSWFQLDDSFTLQGDGWLMGSDKRRLLWIPIQNRKLLWRTQNRRLVISPEEVTTLNLSNFAHGEKWAECFRQDAA
ncbi:hypothetical protein PUNSTDRAFT_130427 [Punctularia strigosozonata HHB-11173 SS5]|uniref:uncharacterized protein n=1 Tax=Punctularia strigosozonata (strain HHB-11173) TaxID=741275 RepID=UPI000441758C|nr:uncharacterized protein PUNSTDRAFT_130427 [Punctularia strigosozonata HHB-11173 SS5]EIN12158.1 hypothetical protein PUNSTDRAFT_130427 [Punctularia strigosozonata HHB-11173 SS5]